MTNPLLETDIYKISHLLLYPEGTQIVYETLTPRKNSYFPWSDKMTVFGYELFFHRLHKHFQEDFFDLPIEEAVNPVVKTVAEVLGDEVANSIKPKYEALHNLGYLPIKVSSLKEGTAVPMQVPVLTIENTDPDFYWLPGYLETSLLSSTFVTSTVASTIREFKSVGYLYGMLTSDNIKDPDSNELSYLDFQFHDFSERGQHGNEAALLSGIAHLTGSHGTDVIQSVDYIQNNFKHSSDYFVGGSVLATEHSIMETLGGKFGTDLKGQIMSYEYLIDHNPNGILSVVSDTYDYWQVIFEVLPKLKEKILARNGKLVIRPDSLDNVSYGLVETLNYMWKIFGGTVNSKGYKVLDSHIGLLHGEGVSLDTVNEYMSEIAKAGFSTENIVFGVGAYVYSVQASRDSFGQALKATDVIVDGKEVAVFKDPKTTSESFKKSLRGRVSVKINDKGNYSVTDGHDINFISRNERLNVIYDPKLNTTESLKTKFGDIRYQVSKSAYNKALLKYNEAMSLSLSVIDRKEKTL